VKPLAIIVASVSIVRLYVRAVQNVMAPIVGFHDGCPDNAAERDKKKRFDHHVCSIPSAARSKRDDRLQWFLNPGFDLLRPVTSAPSYPSYGLTDAAPQETRLV
jgi:hypothetical protein